MHRDIKPDNILFGADGKVKLIDFGFATYIGDTNLTELVGTSYYTAPEVLNNDYSFQCDIWSVGVTLFFLVCGFFPFAGENDVTRIQKIKNGKINFPDGVHG